jgi:transcriptional regulator with XRE-family HTH domain
MNELSNHLKRQIETSGLTITELAHRAGMNRTYIHDVFRGRFIPKPDRLNAILDALGVDESVRSKTQELRLLVREETRAKRPSRQHKFSEGMMTKELQVFLAEKECPAEAGKSGGADLIVKKNGNAFGIFVRFAISDHHQVLGLALDIKKREKFKWCFVVVQVLSDQDKSFKGLFAEYQVSIVSIVTWDTMTKEFCKEKPPIEKDLIRTIL